MRRYIILKIFFAALVLGILIATAFSLPPPYQIFPFTIDGGGGTLTGNNFSLSGTVGQTDVGVHTGGDYTLVGGFWAMIDAGTVETGNSFLMY